MKGWKRGAGCAAVLLAGLWLSGCVSAQMALHPQLQSVEPWTVSGRAIRGAEHELTFGPYRATDVERSWKRTTTIGILMWSKNKSAQNVSYTMVIPGGQTGRVTVANRAHWKAVSGGDQDSSFTWQYGTHSFLGAQFVIGETPWSMELREGDSDSPVTGLLTDGTTRVTVEATRALEGSPFPLTDVSGFRFLASGDGRVLGAVEVINAGRVWLQPDLPESLRDALGTAAAALLFYDDLAGMDG